MFICYFYITITNIKCQLNKKDIGAKNCMIFIQSYKFENGLKERNCNKVMKLAFRVSIKCKFKNKISKDLKNLSILKDKKIINFGGKNENFPSIKY